MKLGLGLGLSSSTLQSAGSIAAGGGAAAAALAIFFTSATAATGTVTDTIGTKNTLTFERSSTAAYWDSDGILQTAASNVARVGSDNRKPVTNLLPYPEQFDNPVWTNARSSESSGQLDPFGGTRAFKLIEDGTASNTHYIYYPSGPQVRAGKKYTFSCYAKASERSRIRLFPSDTNSTFSSTDYAQFDLSAGTTETIGGTSYLSAGITRVQGASGWYRCWVTADANNTGLSEMRIFLASSSGSSGHVYSGDGSSGLYIFGAMLNEGGIEDYIGTTNLEFPDQNFASGWDLTNILGFGSGSTSNNAVAPNGTSTMDTIVESTDNATHCLSNGGINVESSTYYNYSVFVRPNGRTICYLNLVNPAVADNRVWFNLSSGIVGTKDSDITASIKYHGNGVYRISAAIETTASQTSMTTQIGLADADNSFSYTGDGSSGIDVWGAQMTKGAALYPYVGMHQTGFVKIGYTGETAATNLITDSEDLTAASWNIVGTNSITRTADQSIFADGLTTMDRLEITDTTNEIHGINDTITMSINTDYAASGFFRADEQRYIGFRLYGLTNHWVTVVYDLLSGTVAKTGTGATSGTLTDYGIISCGDGLYRCWMSGQIANVSTSNIGIFTFNSGNPTFDVYGCEAYAGTAGDGFFAGGIQFETGTYPSSYIKTSGSTATRAVDQLQLSAASADAIGLADYRNNITFVSEFKRDGYVSGGGHVFYYQLDGNDYVSQYTFNGQEYWYGTTDAGAGALNALLGTGYGIKTAFAFGTDDAAFSIDGDTTPTTDTSTGSLETTDGILNFYIGGANNSALRGSMKTFHVYSERKSNADLATLSSSTDDGTAWIDEKIAYVIETPDYTPSLNMSDGRNLIYV